MAGTNIRDVLGGRQLSGLIKTIKTLVPVDHLPPGLLAPSGKNIQGNSCAMYQVTSTRKTARAVQFGSASKLRTLSGVAEQSVVLAHFAEHIEMPADMLLNLESPDGDKQTLGQAEVQRQLGETKDILSNTRAAAVMSVFSLGALYLDSDGQLLASSSGAQVNATMNIPAGNQNQLAINGGSAVITQSWATASAKIVDQVTKFRKAATKFNGYTPEIAMYGAGIPDLFLRNDQTYGIIKNNIAYNTSFSQGVIPNGFLGFEWFPAYNCFYDVSGTVTSVFPDDQITFTPRVSGDWYELLEGTKVIPGAYTNGTPGGTIASVLDSMYAQKGMFMYAYQSLDPVGATMVYGDTFLPYIKVPGAVYIADVVF